MAAKDATDRTAAIEDAEVIDRIRPALYVIETVADLLEDQLAEGKPQDKEWAQRASVHAGSFSTILHWAHERIEATISRS